MKIITLPQTTKDLSQFLGIEEVVLRKCLRVSPLFYRNIRLKKKAGGTRQLLIPRDDLKVTQRAILDKILSQAPLSPCVYGFSQKKSIVENAKIHSQNPYLLNLDIKEFFPSVNYIRVHKIYSDLGFSKNLSGDLCKLTTHKNQLPQGAPTSPRLASLALLNLDRRLVRLAKQNFLTYTRYFDDISFSGRRRVASIEKDILQIIEGEGYKVRTQKRRLFSPNEEKEINGILIKNGNLSLKNAGELLTYVKEINLHGLSVLKTDNPEKERRSLQGRISFLKQIDPKQGARIETIFRSIIW